MRFSLLLFLMQFDKTLKDRANIALNKKRLIIDIDTISSKAMLIWPSHCWNRISRKKNTFNKCTFMSFAPLSLNTRMNIAVV